LVWHKNHQQWAQMSQNDLLTVLGYRMVPKHAE